MKNKIGEEEFVPLENSDDTLTQNNSDRTEFANIQLTLNFIEDFFSNHFTQNDTVPFAYLMIVKLEMKRQIEKIACTLTLDETIDKDLAGIVIQNLYQSSPDIPGGITYSKLAYRKKLITELLSPDNAPLTTQAIRAKLYFLNFNEDNFVAYEYARLQKITENTAGNKEKITALLYEQKMINQLPTILNLACNTFMPSLKEQLKGWIEEEIKYLEKGSFTDKSETANTEKEDKIHTTLSVAKLALIIRLLVVDKIIINRTVAPMLRIVAKLFTTLQKEDISFGSLETKYHAPDKATINTVKDMLFKWINILGKL